MLDRNYWEPKNLWESIRRHLGWPPKTIYDETVEDIRHRHAENFRMIWEATADTRKIIQADPRFRSKTGFTPASCKCLECSC